MCEDWGCAPHVGALGWSILAGPGAPRGLGSSMSSVATQAIVARARTLGHPCNPDPSALSLGRD